MYTLEEIQSEIDFRLWMFGLALTELKKYYNRSYKENLLGKVTAFTNSDAVTKHASEEQLGIGSVLNNRNDFNTKDAIKSLFGIFLQISCN